MQTESIKEARLWTRSYSMLCGAGFMTYMAFYSLLPALPLFFAERLHISGWQAGAAMSAYTVSAIITRLYCGWLLDSYGRRRVYLGSFGVFSLLFLGYALIDGWTGMLLLRIFHGGLWGLVTSSAQTAVADTVPAQRRGEGMGLFGLFFSIAMAISPICAMWVIERFDYAHLFVLEACAAFIGFTLAGFASFLPAPGRRGKFRLLALIERTTLPLGCVIFIFAMGYGSIVNWISVHAASVAGAKAGWFFTCVAIGTGGTRVLSGRVFDRRGPLLLCGVGFAAFAAALFTLAFVSQRGGFYAAGLLLGVGSGILMPVGLAAINGLVRAERRGAANSTYFTLFDCGIGSGIFITGALAPHAGLGGVWSVFGCCAILAAVLFYAFAWPWTKRRQLAAGVGQ